MMCEMEVEVEAEWNVVLLKDGITVQEERGARKFVVEVVVKATQTADGYENMQPIEVRKRSARGWGLASFAPSTAELANLLARAEQSAGGKGSAF